MRKKLSMSDIEQIVKSSDKENQLEDFYALMNKKKIPSVSCLKSDISSSLRIDDNTISRPISINKNKFYSSDSKCKYNSSLSQNSQIFPKLKAEMEEKDSRNIKISSKRDASILNAEEVLATKIEERNNVDARKEICRASSSSSLDMCFSNVTNESYSEKAALNVSQNSLIVFSKLSNNNNNNNNDDDDNNNRENNEDSDDIDCHNLKIESYFSLSDCANSEVALCPKSAENGCTNGQLSDLLVPHIEISNFHNKTDSIYDVNELSGQSSKNSVKSPKFCNPELLDNEFVKETETVINSVKESFKSQTCTINKNFEDLSTEKCDSNILDFVILPFQNLTLCLNTNQAENSLETDCNFSHPFLCKRSQTLPTCDDISKNNCVSNLDETSDVDINPKTFHDDVPNSPFEVETMKPNEDVNPEKPRNIVETNTSKTALIENLVSEKDIKSEEEKSGDDSMNTREVDGNDSEEELELLLFQPSIENTCPNLNSEELKSFFIDVDDDDYENEDIDVGSIDTISVNEFNNSGSLYSDWDQETSLKHKITNPNFEDGDEDVDVVSEEIGSVHGVSGSDLELKLSETECEEEEFEGFEEVSPKKITKFKGVVMNLAKNSLSEEKSCEGLIQTLDQMNYSGSTAEKNTIEYQIANNKYNCDKKLFTDNEFKLCNSFDNIKEKFDSDLNASHDDDDKFKQFESRANSEITSEKYDNKRLNNEGKKGITPDNFSYSMSRKYHLRNCKNKYISSVSNNRLCNEKNISYISSNNHRNEKNNIKSRKRSLSAGDPADESKRIRNVKNDIKNKDICFSNSQELNSSKACLTEHKQSHNSCGSFSGLMMEDKLNLESCIRKRKLENCPSQENINFEDNGKDRNNIKRKKAKTDSIEVGIGDTKGDDCKSKIKDEKGKDIGNHSLQECKMKEFEDEAQDVKAYSHNKVNNYFNETRDLEEGEGNKEDSLCMKSNEGSQKNVKKLQIPRNEVNHKKCILDKEDVPTIAIGKLETYTIENNKVSDQTPFNENFYENNKLRMNYAFTHMNKDSPRSFESNGIVSSSVCSICFRKCFSEFHTALHLSEHFQGEMFKCIMCGYKTLNFTDLWCHIKIHSIHKNQIFMCSHCDKKFRGILNIIYHMKLHERKFYCFSCSLEFDDINNMKIHSCFVSSDQNINCMIKEVHKEKTLLLPNQNIMSNLTQNRQSVTEVNVKTLFSSNMSFPNGAPFTHSYDDAHSLIANFDIIPADVQTQNMGEVLLRLPHTQEKKIVLGCEEEVKAHKGESQKSKRKNYFIKKGKRRNPKKVKNICKPLSKLSQPHIEEQKVSQTECMKFKIFSNQIHSECQFVGLKNDIPFSNNDENDVKFINLVNNSTNLKILNENLTIREKLKPGYPYHFSGDSNLQSDSNSLNISHVVIPVNSQKTCFGNITQNNNFRILGKNELSRKTNINVTPENCMLPNILSKRVYPNSHLITVINNNSVHMEITVCDGKSVNTLSHHNCKRNLNRFHRDYYSKEHSSLFKNENTVDNDTEETLKFAICGGKVTRYFEKSNKFSEKSNSLKSMSNNDDQLKSDLSQLPFVQNCNVLQENMTSKSSQLNVQHENFVTHSVQNSKNSQGKISLETACSINESSGKEDEVSPLNMHEKQIVPPVSEDSLNNNDKICSCLRNIDSEKEDVTKDYLRDLDNSLEFIHTEKEDALGKQQINPLGHVTIDDIKPKDNLNARDKTLNLDFKDDMKLNEYVAANNSACTIANAVKNNCFNSLIKEEVKAEELGKESLTSDNTSGFINPDKENAIAEQQMNPSSHVNIDGDNKQKDNLNTHDGAMDVQNDVKLNENVTRNSGINPTNISHNCFNPLNKEEVKVEESGRDSSTLDSTLGFISKEEENAFAEQQINPFSHVTVDDEDKQKDNLNTRDKIMNFDIKDDVKLNENVTNILISNPTNDLNNYCSNDPSEEKVKTEISGRDSSTLDTEKENAVPDQQINPFNAVTVDNIKQKNNLNTRDEIMNLDIKDDVKLNENATINNSVINPTNSLKNYCLNPLPKEEVKTEESEKESSTSNSNLYQCKYCTFGTDKLFKFNIHLSVHSEQNPFECSFCPNMFSTFKLLKRHMLMHTKEV